MMRASQLRGFLPVVEIFLQSIDCCAAGEPLCDGGAGTMPVLRIDIHGDDVATARQAKGKL
jgi:hypothetical protein